MAAKRKYSDISKQDPEDCGPSNQKKRKIEKNKRPNMDDEDKDRWDELCESIKKALDASFITDIVEAIADMANGFWCECCKEDCNGKLSCTNEECLDPYYKTCLECGTSQWLIKCSVCDNYGTWSEEDGHCTICWADYCQSCVGICDRHQERELCADCAEQCWNCTVNYCRDCECDCEPL